MSIRTAFVAVAVKAKIGTLGKSYLNFFKFK